MVAAGLMVIAAALLYWRGLQSTPEYVASRGARALFEDNGLVQGLPWQPDELGLLGIDEKKAQFVLGEIKRGYLNGARTVNKGRFVEVKGNDAYVFDVEVEPGLVVSAAVVVITEDGKGYVQFSDLVATYRNVIYAAERERSPSGTADRSCLNGVSQILIDNGVGRYFDFTHNAFLDWPIVEPGTT
jgi:hypothetical protein